MHPWTRSSLQHLVSDDLRGTRLIAVSNREPYIHTRRNHRIECMQPASGVISAIDPIMRASGGTWVAHGSGDADRQVVDARHHVGVPPERPAYTLRRVWLTPELEREYYYGLANEGLWPLCHVAFQRPRFPRRNWESYRRVNQLFAEAVLEEANGDPALVFIQDYHFGLLPRLLKDANPRLTIAQFWHIPWPACDIFRTFPWRSELLDGMLGSDLLGFHLRSHCSNFLETVDRNLEALIDYDRSHVTRAGHTTAVRAFPIGVDFEAQVLTAASAGTADAMARWRAEIGEAEILGIGIDRIDYTKGIPERLDAIEALLEEHPEYLGRFVFVQIGVPSRTAIAEYHELNERIAARVDAINRRWGSGAWKPVVLIRRHVDQKALVALHLLADFCIVSSLDDGMNLVAKEFVASRIDEDGVLVLSSFAGAARELGDALIVNPFSPEEMAKAIHAAIYMPATERHRRMTRMRAVVASNNIYRWAGKLLSALSRMEQPGVVEGSENFMVHAEVA